MKLPRYGITSPEMIDHVVELTTRVNQHDERFLQLEADFVRVTGEVSVSSNRVIVQVNTLTEAVRELRTAMIPPGQTREKLITLPNIEVDEIRAVIEDKLDKDELEKRRRESLRAKDDQKDFKRDARNAKLLFWITIAGAIAGELFRILVTHKL